MSRAFMTGMPKQQQDVLAAIRKWGPVSDSQLSLISGHPQASCRRAVQALRAAGYNITMMSPKGSEPGYKLHEEAQ